MLHERSDGLGRSIRILRTEATKETLEIAAWPEVLEFFKEPEQFCQRTEELVVNLALSSEAAALARTLIARWMDVSVARERREDMILSDVPLFMMFQLFSNSLENGSALTP